MKRIGLLGGMSWESSAEYYRFVNEAVRKRLGGLHSADCLLRSVDFAAVEELQRAGRWNQAGELLTAEALALVAGGAELLVLCTNTMRRVADQLAAAVEIRFAHIAETTADAVRAAGWPPWACWPRRTPWSRTSTSDGWRASMAWRWWCPLRRTGAWSMT